MNIKWLGHASFQLENADGGKLVTDPYDASVGYELTYPEADVVTSSHDHHDHNAFDTVKGEFEIIKEPGKFSAHGYEIEGIPSFHDNTGGSQRGGNIIFNIVTDGIRICHLGDLGHVPDEDMVARIGRVDVLMVPTGGTYTLDQKGARDTCNVLMPRLVIPMHFKTRVCKLDLTVVERFMELMKADEYSISNHYSDELEMITDWLPKRPKVVVMDYK